MNNKKIILTGIQATSDNFHIGNYLSALSPIYDLGKENDVYIMIADMHSINTVHSGDTLRKNTLEILKQLTALFKNIPSVKIFRQSAVSISPEIALILGSVTPLALMMRAHKFKESEDKGTYINLGTFNYPALMAADILGIEADLVTIGQDQKQHIEFTRDIADSFNKIYGKILKKPDCIIKKEVALISGTDGEGKMSKSQNNYIGIFEDEKTLHKKIMKIKTNDEPYKDPKDPDKCIVYEYISLFGDEKDVNKIRTAYLNGEFGYGDAKKELFNILLTKFEQERAYYFSLNGKSEINELMVKTSETEKEIKEKYLATLSKLRHSVGFD